MVVLASGALAALLVLAVGFASGFLVTGAFAITGAVLAAAVDVGLAAAVLGAAFVVTLDWVEAAFVKVLTGALAVDFRLFSAVVVLLLAAVADTGFLAGLAALLAAVGLVLFTALVEDFAEVLVADFFIAFAMESTVN